eukprot:TRINITY_DN3435_c0_g1_i1.p1 TRINITY_DN3435_c0_g1~~TRINITY_DN3435_c0_g1_i1.p1  ORF type:complete len:675 (+),score=92.85 TRINITY_DN3435_c0_g1_i1:354-2378(+)
MESPLRGSKGGTGVSSRRPRLLFGFLLLMVTAIAIFLQSERHVVSKGQAQEPKLVLKAVQGGSDGKTVILQVVNRPQVEEPVSNHTTDLVDTGGGTISEQEDGDQTQTGAANGLPATESSRDPQTASDSETKPVQDANEKQEGQEKDSGERQTEAQNGKESGVVGEAAEVIPTDGLELVSKAGQLEDSGARQTEAQSEKESGVVGEVAEAVPADGLELVSKASTTDADAGRGELSAAEPDEEDSACSGRRIFIYDMPAEFNYGILDNCPRIHRKHNMCRAVNNSGLGPLAQLRPAKGRTDEDLRLLPEGCWFETDQYSLEITFHARLLEYPCLTNSPAKATLFYIPFYAGLAVMQSLSEKDLEERDRQAQLAVQWLQQFPHWEKHQGRDHAILVSRSTSAFARGLANKKGGNSFLSMSHMQNVAFLSLESHPGKKLENTASVPYPTSFHPSSDKDIRLWQGFVRTFPRKHAMAYAGLLHAKEADLRGSLAALCERARPFCKLFRCTKKTCMQPHNVIWPYLSSDFCFQPPGETASGKGLFDCMLAGGIPVVFQPATVTGYFWHLPNNFDSYLVYHSRDAFRTDNGTSLLRLLHDMTPEEIARKRQAVVNLIPSLVYAMPGHKVKETKDAFDITVEAVLQKVSRLQLPSHPGLPDAQLTSVPDYGRSFASPTSRR